MRKIIFISLAFFMASPIHAQVQQDSIYYPKQKFFKRVKSDLIISGKTIVESYKRPLQWEKKEWLMLGGVLALSAGVSVFDQQVYEHFRNNRDENRFFAEISEIGDFMGQPENNYPFMGAVWGLGVITNSEWLRDTGLMIFASVTTSGLVQTALKDIVGRARPAVEDGPFKFRPFNGSAYHSFPSGHTMLALASAYILAHQINFMPGKILVFSIPIITGFSRIHDGAHFVSDIILGSALGVAFAESVLRLYPKIKAKQRGDRNKLAILPGVNGIRLIYSF